MLAMKAGQKSIANQAHHVGSNFLPNACVLGTTRSNSGRSSNSQAPRHVGSLSRPVEEHYPKMQAA